jgi:ferritin-like metal-binding protein YciE
MSPFNSKYLLNLQNIYFAENYCHKRLPGLVQKIPKNELRDLLDGHTGVISSRKVRLERILMEINSKASGIVCLTFKKLIGKAGNIIYHINTRKKESVSELISALLEISIYRSYIYNSLLEVAETIDKPLIADAFKKCLQEEDDFFHSLLRVKTKYASVEFALNAAN